MAKGTVRKAVVLAAGHGTRLRPFTCATPKPLMPVWGVSMIDRIVDILRERGVDDIMVNSHHLPGQIRAWADSRLAAERAAGGRVSIAVSHEPEILGSGGALNPMREWIGDSPFYLVNADIVLDGAPDVPVPEGDEIGVCLAAASGPRTIEVEPASGYVTNWNSDDAGVDGTWTYCGFAVLSPDILRYVGTEGRSSIVSAYEKAMMDGRFVRALMPEDLLWEDAGTVDRYVALNEDGGDNAFADMPQLKATGAADFRFLSSRGSERVFFGCDKGVAIIYDDGNREENGRYAGHARWLKSKGMPVPAVVFDDPGLKTLVMEDAGAEKKMSLEEYVKVVEALAAFNALGAAPDVPSDIMPPFDGGTWKWERDLFAKHCLGSRFGMEMPADVEAELEKVAERLEREPKALVHRDFQSSNILWRGGDFAFIDFQGMRLGPAVYDLASLLYDPYREFSEGERRALATLYAKKSGRGDVADVLPFAAVQRLAQCLGAFGRLASVGQPQFGRYTLPALANLLDAADDAGLDATGALAEDLIARERKMHSASGGCACGHDHGGGHHHGHHGCGCGRGEG